jgi:DNA-directed RNA polymerase specialized sigma24 family protein
VARAIDRWEPGRGSFRGWLSRIARNLLINFLTRRQHQSRGSGATSVRDLLEAQPAVDAIKTRSPGSRPRSRSSRNFRMMMTVFMFLAAAVSVMFMMIVRVSMPGR